MEKVWGYIQGVKIIEVNPEKKKEAFKRAYLALIKANKEQNYYREKEETYERITNF